MMFRKILTGKMTFGQRLEGGEIVNHVVIRTATFQTKEITVSKALEYLMVRRHRWMVVQVGEEKRGDGALLGRWKDLGFCSECGGEPLGPLSTGFI